MLCFIPWCLLLLGYTQSQNVSDLCGETNRLYLPFTRPNERLITNEQSGLSDTFLREDWYGTKGFIIPHNPPGRPSCGSNYPIYLKERPTSPRNIEAVKACVQVTRECQFELQIKALICSPSLTLYRLERAPIDDSAYCLVASGSDDFPDFQTKPSIAYTLKTPSSGIREYEFTCDFTNPESDNLLFKTEWFVDDVSVFESNFSEYEDNNKVRALTDTKLMTAGITTVGFQLNCEVRAGFTRNRVAGLPSKSKKKFIGIEVENAAILVQEGGETKISIRPSVEIGCNDAKGCKLSVTVASSPTNSCLPTVGVKGDCGVQIVTDNWNAWKSLQIFTSATQDYDGRTVKTKIYLKTLIHYVSQPLWQNYSLPPITVIISKDTQHIEGRACMFSNDPYLRDFKNRMLRFELAGVFLLFKTDNVEIQVQVYPCVEGSTGYCICGVIIRVGRTAFMINHCNYNYWFIDYILCDDGGDVLDVKKNTKDETKFKVYLPTGTKVNLDIHDGSSYHWMGIEISPSIIDYDKTSGLCNELNNFGVMPFPSRFWWWNDRENLGTDETFFNKWKLNNDSILNLFVRKNLQSVQQWSPVVTYQHCKCIDAIEGSIDEKIDCDILPISMDCAFDDNYNKSLPKRCISPSRKKRSLPTLMSIDVHHRQKRDVSWKNGWTAERADEYCTDLFNNSKSIERCNGIKGLDIGGAVQSCITDIQLSGTTVFALASISTVSSHCLKEASMNRTLRQETVKEGKSILELVKEVSCPGECSDQGRCEQGKCICNSGFIGSDCTVSLNQPPLAANLEADGHCDLSEDDCSEVAVFGGRFVDHEQTKCKLHSIKIKNDKMIVSDDVVVKTAVFETIGEVTCKLPSRKRKRSVDVPVIDETVTGYKVSVSNNGKNYSQQLNMIIYNTDCVNCKMVNSDMMCSFSPTHCILDDVCYGNGTMYNIGDTEYMCRADNNGKRWLNVVNETVQDEVNYSEQATVIGISVAAVVVFIITGAIMIWIWKKKEKSKRGMVTINPSTNPAYDEQGINPYDTIDSSTISFEDTHPYNHMYDEANQPGH